MPVAGIYLQYHGTQSLAHGNRACCFSYHISLRERFGADTGDDFLSFSSTQSKRIVVLGEANNLDIGLGRSIAYDAFDP